MTVEPNQTLSAQKPSSDGKQPKRRRNRTMRSCLNCHTAKRMCDRKRPTCSRCTQLGITDLCIYEVEDPSQRCNDQDENARLLKRIAELEGVIRELRDKTETRYGSEEASVASGSDRSYSSSPFNSTAIESSFQTSSHYLGHQIQNVLPEPDPALFTYFEHSGLKHDLDGMRQSNASDQFQPNQCGCLQEAFTYKSVMDLSVQLRKAADALAHSPRHYMKEPCFLSRQIADLEYNTLNALGNVQATEQACAPSSTAAGSFYQTPLVPIVTNFQTDGYSTFDPSMSNVSYLHQYHAPHDVTFESFSPPRNRVGLGTNIVGKNV